MKRPFTETGEALDFRDALIAAALFLASILTRWLATGGAVYGDESWYLYLARTLGTEAGAEVDHAWFHLLNRPLYYVVFHLGAFSGFVGFRWFGSVVAAGTVALAFGVARALGASRWGAASAASVLCVERPLVEYGAHGFPDPLASAFALGALWAAAKQRPAMTCLLATCCVLSKESFVVVPVLAAYVRLSGRAPLRSHPDAWAWTTALLPTIYVAAITGLGSWSQGIALQGWADKQMSWKHARGMWVGPELWPLLAWCFAFKRWHYLSVWLALPGFYVVWSFGLGRGLAPWYVIGPATLSAVAVALALTDAAAASLSRWGPKGSRIITAAVIASLLPVAWSGIFRTGSHALALKHGLPQVDSGQEVTALLERIRPDSVLLVNCFWSYGYSHLRDASKPATRTFWPTGDDMSELEAAARKAQITILCRTPNTLLKEQLLASRGFQTLLVTPDYWVLGDAPKASR